SGSNRFTRGAARIRNRGLRLPSTPDSRATVMSEPERHPDRSPEEEDPALARLHRDRKPGELDSAMASGSDDGEISATERFEGEVTAEEALEALDPERARR